MLRFLFPFLKNDNAYFGTVLLLLFVLNGAIVFLGVRHIVLEIIEARQVITATKQKIWELDQKRAHFLEAEKTLAKQAGILNRLENTVVSLSDPLPFIELLESLAKEQRLALRLSAEDLVTTGGKRAQNFRAVVEGDFPNVFQYLKFLESFPYQLSLSEAQFEFIPENSPASGGKPAVQGKVLTRMSLTIAVRVKD
jgi:hypothetical protein